jgi:tol-pal system protein YbgF
MVRIMTKKYSHTKWQFLVIILALCNASSSVVLAESENDYKSRPVSVRLDRLERLMSSQKQLEMLYRVNQLQKENQQLRALLEEQGHEIHRLKQQQKDLYSDLNRRLSQMEQSGSLAKPLESDVTVQEQTQQPIVIDKSSTQNKITHPKVINNKPVVKPKVATIKPMSKKERQQEQAAYQKAYNELTARRYAKARDSFSVFVQRYPSGRYAHIAQYWIAESSYAQHYYEQAVQDYQLLLDVYPFSPKKAEAELKKAYSYNKLNNKKAARQTLNQLLLQYPNTTEAGQAKRLLKQL